MSLPHDTEAEQAVIACLMIEDGVFDNVAGQIDTAHFYHKKHATIFNKIKDLHESGKPYDLVSLNSSLTQSGELAMVGGIDYLMQLTTILPNAANISRYSTFVLQKAKLRDMILAANKIRELASLADRDISVDIADIITQAETALSTVAKDVNTNEPRHVSNITHDVLSRAEQLSAIGGGTAGIDTGYSELSSNLNGLQGGSLIIVAGRPAMGKSAFALEIAKNCKKTTLVFSLEMTSEQLAGRLLSSESSVSGHKIQRGMLTNADWELIVAGASKLADYPLYIDDTCSISLASIRSKCRKLKSTIGLDLVIVDYLQLMESKKSEHREQQIAEISRGLKQLAKELSIPIIALSQLNRELEKRKDKRPMLSDLRESGAIEQDADQVLFIYRDEVYNDNTADRGIAEIIIAKNRSGATGTVRLRFENVYTRFSEV